MATPRRIRRVLLGLLLSYIALKTLPAPWLWVLLAWALLAFRRARAPERTTASRASWTAAAGLLCLLGLIEAGVRGVDIAEEWGDVPIHREDLYETVDHDILGSAPPPASSRIARKHHGEREIYAARYTFDEHSLRLTPDCRDTAAQAVLFFGCSMTFGEGLHDEETLPYRVGEALSDDACLYNFALHGYGTHHMLAAIEHGMVDTIVEQDIGHVFYGLLYPAHLYRLTGQESWFRHGPQYALGADGRPEHRGHFDDDERAHPFLAKVKDLAEDALFVRRLLRRKRPIDDADQQLLTAMVIEARDRLAARSPDLAFHVLVWGRRGSDGEDQVLASLRAAGIGVHPVRDIIPDYVTNEARYDVDAHDAHPNALTTRLVAEYVTALIRGE